jgi:hypothetical protein
MIEAADLLRRVASRLQSPHVALLLAGVVLPNLLSIATALSLIDIGLPSRTVAILLYGLVTLLAALLPAALTCVLFLVVLAMDLVWTISQMFGLGPGDLLIALEYAGRIDVLASPLYVSLICVVTATTLVSLNLLARKPVVKGRNTYVLCAAVLLLSAVESTANSPPNSKLRRDAETHQSTDSAVQRSGLMSAPRRAVAMSCW